MVTQQILGCFDALSVFTQVLCSVVHLLTSGCDETTAVSVCGLLRLQASHREAPVLDLMSRCLRLLISNSSWLVRELALESFRTFAEVSVN